MRNDLGDEFLVCLLRILLVENAVFLLLQRQASEAIGAGEAALAISQPISVPARVADDAVEEAETANRLVQTFTAIVAHVINIKRAVCAVHLHAVSAIFAVRSVEALPHVLAVAQRIPLAVLALHEIASANGKATRQFRSVRAFCIFESGKCRKTQLIEDLAIFLLTLLLVEDAEFLLSQVRGEQTMGAAFEITREKTFLAVFAMIEEGGCVTILAEHRFVQQFAAVGPQAIDAIFVLRGIGSIETIFFVVTSSGQITILVCERVVAVFAVLRLLVHDREVWDCCIQFAELFTE